MFNKIKLFLLNHVLPDRVLLLKGASAERSIYLTFDDGPCPGVTSQLLEVLNRHGVLGTFFVVGKYAEIHSELLLDIANQGHSLGNHTYSHPSFVNLPFYDQKQELLKTNQIIESITGSPCNIFRAPQGRWNLRLLWFTTWTKITAVHWSLDSKDYLKESADVIVQRLSENLPRDGDILLFHDDNKICVEALDVLIPLWKSKGFEFKVL